MMQKAAITKIANDYCLSSKDALDDIKDMYHTLESIKNLVIDFKNEYTIRKQEKEYYWF